MNVSACISRFHRLSREPALLGSSTRFASVGSRASVLGKRREGTIHLSFSSVASEEVHDVGSREAVRVGAKASENRVSNRIAEGVAEDKLDRSLAVMK